MHYLIKIGNLWWCKRGISARKCNASIKLARNMWGGGSPFIGTSLFKGPWLTCRSECNQNMSISWIFMNIFHGAEACGFYFPFFPKLKFIVGALTTA